MVSGYRRDDRARLLHITLTGEITASEARDLLNRQVADGTWSYATLFDERAVTTDLAAPDIRTLVAYVASLTEMHGPRGPVAVVVATTVGYGVNRMASAYADSVGHLMEVFRTVDEALVWLEEHRLVPGDRS